MAYYIARSLEYLAGLVRNRERLSAAYARELSEGTIDSFGDARAALDAAVNELVAADAALAHVLSMHPGVLLAKATELAQEERMEMGQEGE